MKQTFRFLTGCILLFVTGLLLPEPAPAQERLVVEGTVKDNAGDPLIGVSVIEAGTTNGVNTDLNGKFRIQVPLHSKLRFSYVGYEPQEITVLKSSYDIRLKAAELNIDQVVVTGYSQTDVRKSTGSVGIISGKEIKDSPIANVDYLLKGKLAGVNVQATSGRPGEAAKIRIRGQSTITGNAEPLWVVDGVPMQQNMPDISSSQISSGDFTNFFATGVGSINPNDIESITVLKDAAAAAIYGSQAAGGVIVVTTKRGKAGRTQVNYMGSVTVQTKPSRSPNLMNSQEKLAWEQELWDEFSAPGFAATQAGNSTHYPVIGIVGMIRAGKGKYAGMSVAEQDAYIEELGQHTTDWFDELFRNSIATSHYLSISGGNEKVTYYTSLGYSHNDGIVLKNSYDTYSFNGKVDIKPNRRLSFGVSTDFSYQKSKAPSSNVDMFKYAYFANPYEKLYNDDGSYRADETYFALTEVNGSYIQAQPENGFNLMREINETSSLSTSANFTLRGNLSYKITDHLTFSGLASFSYVSNFTDNINGKETYAAFEDRPFEQNSQTSKRIYGSIFQNSAYNTSYILRGQLNYARTFGGIHRISVLGGAEIRSSYAKSIFEKRYGYDPVSGNHSTPLFPQTEEGKIDYDKLIQYGKVLDGCMGQSITEDAFASFYGTLDYILKNKYVFSVTARTDGSNNFGSDEQFNVNWSTGFSWNIDEENFMKGAIKKVISSMTLRLATGYTGGVNKTVYPVFIMDYDNEFRITDTDSYRIGSIRNAPNPHLRWERTRDMKAGLEVGFLKERLHLQLEAYHRKSMDLVTKVAVPSTTGFTEQSYNTSEQVNQGFEITLGATPVQVKDFTWRITTNLSYNRNELTKYISPTGSIYGDYYVGYPLNKIFTGICTGINPSTGLYTYKLRPDAVLTDAASYRQTENYLFYVGTSDSPWYGGFTTSFSYKGFTLSSTSSFVIKSKILNNISSPAYYSLLSESASSGVDKETIPTQKNDLYVNHLNVSRDVRNRWTPTNPRTDGYPRLIDAYAGRLVDQNGHYITDDQPSSSTITNCTLLEDVSYLKIGSISLIYSFPEDWIRKLHLSSMSVSFTVNNIYTFTNYSGIDPETPGAVYPQSRAFSFGLSLGF